jgi:hypothetical protein
VKEQHEVILRHQEAIQRHTAAAEAAIKEWNDFVDSVESKKQSPKQ